MLMLVNYQENADTAPDYAPSVGAFHDHDARVLPQWQRQLPVPYIHRKDLGGSVMQEDVREAASAAPDVDGNCAGNIDVELFDGVLELHSSARHPGMRFLSLEPEWSVLGNFGPRTIYSHAAVGDDRSRHDQCGRVLCKPHDEKSSETHTGQGP